MQNAHDRTISLVGADGFDRLRRSHVLVVGLGGVGGAVTEVLARSGVGRLTLVDGDDFEPTNLNRQILCTRDTLGMNKADAAKRRVADIDGEIEVASVGQFVTESNVADILKGGFDYCVDAIDDLKNKVLLITACKRAEIPIISAMGAGNRLDCDFTVTDIFKTQNDPFARKLRHELKKAEVRSLDVVCAISPPEIRSATPASVAAPPFVMGAMLAGFVVKRISEQ